MRQNRKAILLREIDGKVRTLCRYSAYLPTISGIAFNIIPDFPIITLIANDMIIEAFLPNRKSRLFGYGTFHQPDYR